ncbi:MAG: membrane-associated phospholipid phosphatase [Natronomonas sp.]|jgi:membrane-associated phospholipid phosphatase
MNDRGIGESELVAALPEFVVVLAALVTQLGDVWFLFGIVGLLYWFGETLPGPVAFGRRQGAFVLALAMGYRATATTLKESFAYPRPPNADVAPAIDLVPPLIDPLYAAAATGTGFGFPSGHAVGATVVYGGIALLIGTQRAYASAAALAVVVALSRVILGVHYLVDVTVGAAVGLAFLAVAYHGCGRGSKPGRVLSLALAIALLGPIFGEYTFDTMAVLGLTLGARIMWGSIGDAVLHEETTRMGAVAAAVFGGIVAAPGGLAYAIEAAPHVAFLTMAVGLGGVVAAPVVGEAVARRI